MSEVGDINKVDTELQNPPKPDIKIHPGGLPSNDPPPVIKKLIEAAEARQNQRPSAPQDQGPQQEEQPGTKVENPFAGQSQKFTPEERTLAARREPKNLSGESVYRVSRDLAKAAVSQDGLTGIIISNSDRRTAHIHGGLALRDTYQNFSLSRESAGDISRSENGLLGSISKSKFPDQPPELDIYDPETGITTTEAPVRSDYTDRLYYPQADSKLWLKNNGVVYTVTTENGKAGFVVRVWEGEGENRRMRQWPSVENRDQVPAGTADVEFSGKNNEKIPGFQMGWSSVDPETQKTYLEMTTLDAHPAPYGVYIPGFLANIGIVEPGGQYVMNTGSSRDARAGLTVAASDLFSDRNDGNKGVLLRMMRVGQKLNENFMFVEFELDEMPKGVGVVEPANRKKDGNYSNAPEKAVAWYSAGPGRTEVHIISTKPGSTTEDVIDKFMLQVDPSELSNFKVSQGGGGEYNYLFSYEKKNADGTTELIRIVEDNSKNKNFLPNITLDEISRQFPKVPPQSISPNRNPSTGPQGPSSQKKY